MPLLKLPDELLERFNLPPLLAKATLDAATVSTYRSIIISNRRQATRLLDTITSRPQLANLVRALVFTAKHPYSPSTADTWHARKHAACDYLFDHLDLVASLVKQCPRLAHLSISHISRALMQGDTASHWLRCDSLRSLELHTSCSNSAAASPFGLTFECPNLRSLSLRGFRYASDIPVRTSRVTELALALPASLDELGCIVQTFAGDGLEELTLTGNVDGGRATEALCDVLDRSPSLRRLTCCGQLPTTVLHAFTRPRPRCRPLDLLSFSISNRPALQAIDVDKSVATGNAAMDDLIRRIAEVR